MVLSGWLFAAPVGRADDASDRPIWVVTIAGLGGDENQSQRLRESILGLQKAARERWRIPESRRRAIPHGDAADVPKLGASRTQIADSLAELASQVQPGDAVWIFVFAHGNHDGRQTFLHLAGPDAPPSQWTAWLDSLRCREQVVFLTGSSSGWLLKPLAREGRIIVTATAADDEYNATEFPLAMIEAANETLEALDLDRDGRASIAEFFVAIHRSVAKRFSADERIATEHAQLDDDGNGLGSEAEVIERLLKASDAPAASAGQESTSTPRERPDGANSAKVYLPLLPVAPSKADAPTVENAPSETAPTDRTP